MKIVYMGTPDFAVPTLQMLIDEGHNIAAVVTQPDRPKGRGNKMVAPPVKELAMEYDLPVLQPTRVKGDEDFYNHIKALNPDVIIVVAFGQILPKAILELPRLGCINVHGSLLPAYRGAAPIQWAIINREEKTGVTIMYMDEGIDTGDMIYKKEMPIFAHDTYLSLQERMKDVGAKALKEILPAIENGQINREKQDSKEATYAPMIDKNLGEIDWKKSAKEIEALIRGLTPWIVTYTYYQSVPVKIWRAEVVEENTSKQPGTLLKMDKEGFYVQTGDGQLYILEVQLPNKKRMDVSEFIKGNSLEEGYQLGK
jgi:methionyl-tRNA formyltransferase